MSGESDFYRDMISGVSEQTDYIEPEVIEEGGTEYVDDVAVDEAIVETPTYTVPEYLGAEWKPPEDADDAWYKDNYARLASLTSSEDFVASLTDTYREQLLSEEKNVEEFRNLYQAYKSGDVSFLKTAFPEKLLEIGVSPVLSNEDIDNEIEGTLKKEFGDNYTDVYDMKEVIKPSSISHKIFARTQQLVQHWSNENANRTQQFEQYRQSQGTSNTPLDLDKEYEAFKDDMPREQFNTMLDSIREGIGGKWTLKDLHRIVSYDTDIAKAREQGAKEERERLTNGIRQAGNSREVVPQSEHRHRPKEDAVATRGWASMFNSLVSE